MTGPIGPFQISWDYYFWRSKFHGYIFKSHGNIIRGVHTLFLSTSRLYYVIVVGILRRFQQAVYFWRYRTTLISRLRYLLMLHSHKHGGYLDRVINI